MFRFLKNEKKQIALVAKEQEVFLSILKSLLEILQRTEQYYQAEIVRNLIELCNNGKFELLIESVNSVEMWGGSGAVWEIYIENRQASIEFEKKMIELIDLMKSTKILGRGIKPIRRIFEKNLSTSRS